MVAAFFAAVEKHKAGENKDMDIAVYGATGYSYAGFLIVRYATRLTLKWRSRELMKCCMCLPNISN